MGNGFYGKWYFSVAASEIFFLVVEGTNTLTEIIDSLSEKKAHPTIIMHLRRLEKAGVIRGVKKGRTRVYSVEWDAVMKEFFDYIISIENGVYAEFSKDLSPLLAKELKMLFDFIEMLKTCRKNKFISGFVRAYIEGYAEDVTNIHHMSSFSYCIDDFSSKIQIIRKEIEPRLKGKKNDEQLEEFSVFLKSMIWGTSRSHFYHEFENMKEYVKDAFMATA